MYPEGINKMPSTPEQRLLVVGAMWEAHETVLRLRSELEVAERRLDQLNGWLFATEDIGRAAAKAKK